MNAAVQFLGLVIVKATLVLLAGELAALALRRALPAQRHAVRYATLVSILVLPLAMLATPAWSVHMLPAHDAAPTRVTATRVLPPTVAVAIDDQARPSLAPAHLDVRPTVASMTIALWLVGMLVGLCWLVFGHVGLRRLARRSQPVQSPHWRAMLTEECARASIRAPVSLRSSASVSTPLTWGTSVPIILMPETASTWSDDRWRVVLRHELSHVARHDSLAQFIARLACVCYWFHPLAWVATRRLRADSERACDDRVLSLGTPAPDYAAHLLDIARSASQLGATGWLSTAMARPSELEGRLLGVLNRTSHRVTVSRPARVVGAGCGIAMLLALSAFRPLRRIAERPVAPTHADSVVDMEVPASQGGTLALDLETGGGVRITAWDKPTVHVHGALSGAATEVRLEPAAGGGARLISESRQHGGVTSFSHTFDIQVPRQFNVRVASAGGDLSIEGLSGTLTGHTGGGTIDIKHADGHADLTTGGGRVHVSDSHLTGFVGTGGGSVEMDRVTGPLVGHAGGGSDDFVPERMGGTSLIRIDQAGGKIDVPTAPHGARLTTGGGEIHVGPANGLVYASTGGGDIQIGPVDGAVNATTGSGNVTLTLRPSGAEPTVVTTGSGRVVLLLPATVSAQLDLETAYTENYGRRTRIDSDWPLSTTETDHWDDAQGTPRKYVRVRQSIGNGGPLIQVRAVNGDIEVRRMP
jgi:beta-lactamase regulating signal transducer with metallopeptidase domain